MKTSISKYSLFVITAITIISTSIYFVNSELSTPYPGDNLTQSNTATTNNTIAIKQSPENIKQEIQISKRNTTSLDNSNNKNNVMIEGQQITQYEYDLTSPLPSSENFSVKAEGEYAQQINQEGIIEKAKSDGWIPYETADESKLPIPSKENSRNELQNESAQEINQQAITEKAKTDGWISNEVVSKSYLPSRKNISTKLQGEFAGEINQQAIIEKARTEGY